MSEIRLNLIDSQTILSGTIHGAVGDHCVAALSAEPETIAELQAALERFDKEPPVLRSIFHSSSEIDERPYDAGILVIDLASRIVACESTYSLPGPSGTVRYHNGQYSTDFSINYCVPDDWLFLRCVEEYGAVCGRKRARRFSNKPSDARAVLYGRPLLEFLATNVRLASANREVMTVADKPLLSLIQSVHAQWLLTPRADLQNQSPRDVMLARQSFIDYDLDSRARQWSLLMEGPPCLSPDSFAYQFAGFGTHEWVLYYELIRFLLGQTMWPADNNHSDFESLVNELDSLKNAWLNEPNIELDGRVPAIVIDNERRRLPEAMGGRSMVVDEDCPLCKLMGDECEAGLDVCFWHLDCCNMDDHFAFSNFLTEKEYLEDRVETEIRHRKFDQMWKDREGRIARGEEVESDPFFDPPASDEFFPFRPAEAEPPEA